MTVEEVAEAKAAVMANGREPTTRNIREQLGYGSMRDVLRRLHRVRRAPHLAGAGHDGRAGRAACEGLCSGGRVGGT
jgi:hypothetical protein